MKNNYNDAQNLRNNNAEFNKIKQILKNKLSYLLISEEEKDNLVEKIIKKCIEEYKKTTPLPFLYFSSIKLKKEVETTYFKPSTTIPIVDQKIINLYLSKENEQFLSEIEIRKRLQIYSSDIYRIVNKLESTDPKIKKELQIIFPNYKQQLKKRNSFFKKDITISDTDILYLGYYIGEVNDICLDIKEIANKVGKNEIEIKKSLKTTFQSLKQPDILKLIKEKYPNCEKMLQIKAINFGIKLQVEKDEISLPSKQTRNQKRKKEIPSKEKIKTTQLTKQQEFLLKELAKNPNITRNELVKITGYKNGQTLYQILNKLKKRCEANNEFKEKVLELYPEFLEQIKKEKGLLTKQQEFLLKELAKNPNITRNELAKITGKSAKTIWKILNTLKKSCEINNEFKEKVLELYPEFLEQIKKEKGLLTKQQEFLLKELAKNPNITKIELAKITGYKNSQTLYHILSKLKKGCETNNELKEKVLKLYPDFLKPKEQKIKVKKEKRLLTEQQEFLLKELEKNPNITRNELAKNTGYKNSQSVCCVLNTLKKKCEQDEKIKKRILELYPDFLKPKERKIKVKKEKRLLTEQQEVLLKELEKNPNITRNELVEITGYKNTQTLYQVLNKLKKRCEANNELKEKVLELCPKFLEQKIKIKKEKYFLTKQQEVLLKELEKTPNIKKNKLAEITGYKNSQSIYYALNTLKKKCEHDEEIKKRILELYPDFLKSKKQEIELTRRKRQQLTELQESSLSFEQDKIIIKHYKKKRSIKIPSEDIEKIKTFIRQFDIPENDTEKTNNPILIGIKNLEESIFSSYVAKCTEEQKAILALRLGFINTPAKTETIAKLFGIEEKEVITLTKNCLQSAKNTISMPEEAKTYKKRIK